MPNPHGLPPGVVVLERGWLSSNNIVIQGAPGVQGAHGNALIDSGYCTHAEQTLALVHASLQGQSLHCLINTHLHSDHCGGNAALQSAYPGMQTLIPPGHAEQVRQWDEVALSYTPSGQTCPQFGFDAVLQPGVDLMLGNCAWQVHAAPGHDPHSVILFEPISRTLISADALWERGFGVVFPALDGVDAFDEVASTLDVIESLQPFVVIPGHGAVFTDVAQALSVARARLNAFVANPAKHLHHAAKVLLKFRLLEVQRIEQLELVRWAQSTPYFISLFGQHFAELDFALGVNQLVQELKFAGAARLQDGWVSN
jgi:glyoxylase-like metal-dependent hydrolase (beta-lactamase superfamily II)